MNTVLFLILLTLVSGVFCTTLGGIFIASLKEISGKAISYLLSFASGITISVIFFDLVPEAINPDGVEKPLPLYVVGAGVAFGFGIVYFLNYLISKKTNKGCGDAGCACGGADALFENVETPKELLVAGIVMACAIGLHNLPAGLVIGASYVGSESLFNNPGFILSLAISMHNIPEGITVAIPLLSYGMKKGKTLLITALAGVPIVIGALVGFFVGSISPLLLCLSLSFAAGAMFYVVFSELIPRTYSLFGSKFNSVLILIGAIVGFVLISIE